MVTVDEGTAGDGHAAGGGQEREKRGVGTQEGARQIARAGRANVGEDGRGHYGNRGWVSGLRDGGRFG